jgi:hypothetical protein
VKFKNGHLFLNLMRSVSHSRTRISGHFLLCYGGGGGGGIFFYFIFFLIHGRIKLFSVQCSVVQLI